MGIFPWRRRGRAGVLKSAQAASAGVQAPNTVKDNRQMTSLNDFVSSVEQHVASVYDEIKNTLESHMGAIKTAANDIQAIQDSGPVQFAEGLLPAPVRTILDTFVNDLAKVTSGLTPNVAAAPSGAAASQAAAASAVPAVNPGAPGPVA